MGVPARHHSRSRVNKRRSHLALKPLNFIKCSHCKEMIMPHRKEVIDVLKGLSKKEKKLKQKEIEKEK